MNVKPPRIERHDRFDVVRDDLLPGGTKSRYIGALFDGVQEVVYASPAQGAAQIALALKARELGKRCTIFTPLRKVPHPNTLRAIEAGANMRLVSFGMLSNVTAKAAEYAREAPGSTLAPFGLRVPQASKCLSLACQVISHEYSEIWCASGSGTLAAALCTAFPRSRVFAVSVGHKIRPGEAGRAKIIVYDGPFSRPARDRPPFPSSETFDAKAWETMRLASHAKRALFWNVHG